MTIKVLPSKCEAYEVDKDGKIILCLDVIFTAQIIDESVEINLKSVVSRGNVDEVCAAIKEAVMMLTEE